MDLDDRYLTRFLEADKLTLKVESAAAHQGGDSPWWAERHRAMAAAHLKAAREHTAKELALLPAPDNAQAYPPGGGDRW